jgi:hypothetical protein
MKRFLILFGHALLAIFLVSPLFYWLDTAEREQHPLTFLTFFLKVFAFTPFFLAHLIILWRIKWLGTHSARYFYVVFYPFLIILFNLFVIWTGKHESPLFLALGLFAGVMILYLFLETYSIPCTPASSIPLLLIYLSMGFMLLSGSLGFMPGWCLLMSGLTFPRCRRLVWMFRPTPLPIIQLKKEKV